MADITPQAPVLDPQDPLPESNWWWRRLFVFVAFATLCCIRVHATIIHAQLGLLDWLIMLIILCYMIAPSAEQATKMIATMSMLKSGVNLRQTSTVTQTDNPAVSSSTATTTASKAEIPDVEPPSSEPDQPSEIPAGPSGNAPFYTGPDGAPAADAGAARST